MKTNMKQFQILISAPSDIEKEIDIVNKTIQNFNITIGRVNNITLLPIHWKTSSFPESGGDPQSLLNKQIVDNSDAVIAIFWTKFGSPTEKYDSGTEEEIERMLKEDKQVFLYFSNRQINMNKVDLDQYQKIKDFKKKYQNRGIYHTYDSINMFEKSLSNHLNLYFLNEVINTNSKNSKQEKKSKLILKTYDGNSIYNSINFLETNFVNSEFIINKISEIKKAINKINNLNLIKSEQLFDFDREEIGKKSMKDLTNTQMNQFLVNSEYVKLNSIDKELIKEFIKKNEMSINESWFKLGNLKRKVNTLSIYGGKNYKLDGTETEKNKYNKISWIINEIKELKEYKDYFRFLDDCNFLSLIIENSGVKYDEDISIKLYIPKDKILFEEDLEKPQKNIINNLIELVDYIFKPQKTHFVNSYPDYKKNYTSNTIEMPQFINNKSDQEKYNNKLEEYSKKINNLFLFESYKNNKFDILKFHQNYLKHNESNFLPCFLLFKEKVEFIKYEITSKYCPDKIEGTLNLKE